MHLSVVQRARFKTLNTMCLVTTFIKIGKLFISFLIKVIIRIRTKVQYTYNVYEIMSSVIEIEQKHNCSQRGLTLPLLLANPDSEKLL